MPFRLTVLTLTVLASCTPGSPEVSSSSKPSPSNSPEASLSYVVEPDRVRVGVTPRATFINTGNVTLEYGNAYVLERSTAGSWEVVSQPSDPDVYCGFDDIGYSLAPGASHGHGISVCDRQGEPQRLAPGRYRVTKDFGVNDQGATTSPEIRARANFFITGPCGSADTPAGVEVSQRQAIQLAFGKRNILNCSRFEAYLSDGQDGPTWTVYRYRKGRVDCSDFKDIDAVTGESLGKGAACP